MKKICLKCKGEGEYYKREWTDFWLAPITLGVSLLENPNGWRKCKICDGKGYLED